jgi:CBS domain-containing protein
VVEVRIRDLKPRMPITVSGSESLLGAAKQLADEDIGALIVIGSHGITGVLSERDVVRALADGCDLRTAEVCDYMTQAPVVCEEDAAVVDAVAKMNDAGIRHVVVTTAGDVSGMISMRDIVGVLGAVQSVR